MWRLKHSHSPVQDMRRQDQDRYSIIFSPKYLDSVVKGVFNRGKHEHGIVLLIDLRITSIKDAEARLEE